VPSCPNCDKEVKEYWNYCTCGYKLFDNFGFVYDQLFKLMELEGTRRERLDSKASTYIGLLGIAVTILTTFGGVAFQEIATLGLNIQTSIMSLANYVYILTILSLIAGVISAFRAFREGSTIIPKEIDKNDPEYQSILSKSFWNMDYGYLAKNIENLPPDLKNPLIEHLKDIVDHNYTLNNSKSNKLIWAYWLTLTGIVLLLALTIVGFIGVRG
jgi:hypothetical protein